MSLIQVVHRGPTARLHAAGLEHEGVVAYWWGWEADGRSYEQLSYVLLDEAFVINQPVGFPPEQRGWWYCDLVSLHREPGMVTFEDLYIDVIIGPGDHPYRVLDLDEFADSMASGAIDPARAMEGLRRTQAFLDRRLNRRHETSRTWPDFPPAAVLELGRRDDLPREWRWEAAAP